LRQGHHAQRRQRRQRRRAEALRAARRLPNGGHAGAAARHDRSAPARGAAFRGLCRKGIRAARRWAVGPASGAVARGRDAIHAGSRASRRARRREVHSMIPLVDLKAQYQFLKPEIAAAIELVLDSGQFVLGDQVAAFEQEFAHYVGAAEGIGVNTGTSALHLALLAAGVGPDDEVITVPFTFVATVAAIDYTGARAVFVDIDPVNYTMDVTQLERAVTPRTKAIVPVHLYGHSADMDPLLEVARRHGLVVIEDACQAHGAEYKNRRVGSIGRMGCFSFYRGKNLGACGEGGMAVTSDRAR